MPPNSDTTALSNSTALVLRRILLVTYPPAFIILVIQGIISGKAFPALLLLPQFFSSFLSALLLYRDKIAAPGSPVAALSASNVDVCDLLLALWTFTFLVPSWMTLDHMRRDAGLVILGSYGTVFGMTNFCIHSYFVLAQAWHIMTTRGCQCPGCRSWAVHGDGNGDRRGAANGEYDPLIDDEEAAVAAEEGRLIGTENNG